jgi:ubiquitin-protein ligase
METTLDFSLTEEEIGTIKRSIENARAVAQTETARAAHGNALRNRRPHTTTRRLLSEINGLIRSASDAVGQGPSNFSFSIVPLQRNVRELLARFPGPVATPYEGGVFYLGLSIPDGYPVRPPHVWFCTKIYHPNVHWSGEVCAHGLNVDWNAAWCLRTLVLSVASLLSAPDLSDPLVGEVARHFFEDPSGFEKTAREWTAQYAVGELSFPGQRTDEVCTI